MFFTLKSIVRLVSSAALVESGHSGANASSSGSIFLSCKVEQSALIAMRCA